jgi:hypothetical protein
MSRTILSQQANALTAEITVAIQIYMT